MSAPSAAASTFARRLDILRSELPAEGLDGLLVSKLSNVRYLSGFSGSSGHLLMLPERSVLFTDFRYEEQASGEVDPVIEVRISRDGLLEEVAAFLDERGLAGRLGFEPESVTVRDRHELGELCDRVMWETAPTWVESQRVRKGQSEIEAIESAARIGEAALQELLSIVREGVTERTLAAELDYRLRLAGSGPPAFETIVAAGPRSALPHAQPSDREIRSGDLVLFDFGATVGGYCSDMTRTFVLGQAAEWQREVHQAVAAAQEAAMAVISAGVAAREVDAAARKVLRAAGMAERFGHGTGHGIGLEVHEAPRIYRRSDDVLEAGSVVTVEPGVYLPGRGGVRIEDDVVVEETGARTLTRYSRDLIEL